MAVKDWRQPAWEEKVSIAHDAMQTVNLYSGEMRGNPETIRKLKAIRDYVEFSIKKLESELNERCPE